jgi:UDP-glucose 4-epimerase
VAILVTGGAGFIGSHTCLELLGRGHDVVVVDNFSNSSPAALDAVRELAGRPVAAHELDMRDHPALDRVFAEHPIEAVIHFAAKKAVGESMQIPLEYFDINLAGTTNLLRTMHARDVRKLVFSSSCSIYGDQYAAPITEADPPCPTNPYARSKLMCEQILADACARYAELSMIALRYFNPVGGHPSGRLGEDPRGVPGNVMPYMMQVAVGRLDKLTVFGTDYDTPDGSGTGVSVLQLIAAFQEACGVAVPYEIAGRRPGDAASAVADPSRVEKEWGWRTSRDLRAMCADAWRFQSLHPQGYPA